MRLLLTTTRRLRPPLVFILALLALVIHTSEAFAPSRSRLAASTTPWQQAQAHTVALSSNQRRRRVSSGSNTHLQFSLVDSASLMLATTDSSLPVLISPEPIHTLFSVATFLPQPFWLLMILAPKAKLTKQVMGGFGRLHVCLFVWCSSM